MEQFAAIRLLARSLRAEAAVADTETAIEVARQAAKHLALKIRALPAHDIELEGAHGLLDRQFKTILVRNDLPEPVLAEVLAHEIGHFQIHDGPERGYYPRSEANGGVPGQRIETYGITMKVEASDNALIRR